MQGINHLVTQHSVNGLIAILLTRLLFAVISKRWLPEDVALRVCGAVSASSKQRCVYTRLHSGHSTEADGLFS